MKAIKLMPNPTMQEIAMQPLELWWIRIKVIYSGLCWSDMHRIRNNTVSDITLWHEFVGQIIEINGVKWNNLQIWDYVACNPLLACDECDNCQLGFDNLCRRFFAIWRNINGAFAEFVDIPYANAYRIEEENIKTAVLNDVVAVWLHAIDEFINSQEDDFLIIGDGAVWIMICCLLVLKWAKSVTLKWKHKANYEYIQSIFPQIHFIDGSNLKWTFWVVFETVGWNQLDTLRESIEYVATRWSVIVLGVYPPDMDLVFNNRDLFLKEANIHASVAYKKKYFAEWLEILKRHKKLLWLITHEIDISKFTDWVHIMNNKLLHSPVIKVIYEHM